MTKISGWVAPAWLAFGAALLVGASAAMGAGAPLYAQADERDRSQADPPSGAASQMDQDQPQSRAGGVKAMQLLGTEVKNTRDETIGEVASVYLDPNGRVQDVIVSISGFLGMSARDVAISWNDVRVEPDGDGLTTTLSEEELKALPEYEYRNEALRGKVFGGGSQ